VNFANIVNFAVSLSAPFSSSYWHFCFPRQVRRCCGGGGQRAFGCDCVLLLEAAARRSSPTSRRLSRFLNDPGNRQLSVGSSVGKLADGSVPPAERRRRRMSGSERQTRGSRPAAARGRWFGSGHVNATVRIKHETVPRRVERKTCFSPKQKQMQKQKQEIGGKRMQHIYVRAVFMTDRDRLKWR
jgi:hypothetical protein